MLALSASHVAKIRTATIPSDAATQAVLLQRAAEALSVIGHRGSRVCVVNLDRGLARSDAQQFVTLERRQLVVKVKVMKRYVTGKWA